MTSAARVLRAGIVVLADAGPPSRVIVLQYNPETITRTIAPLAVGPDAGDRLEALRLRGPATETWKLEAELDALDQPGADATVDSYGIAPALAVLESLLSPTVRQVQNTLSLASQGTLEITPVEAPLTVFVWGASRVMPVRITECTITEEAFRPDLLPLRARVSLGMRVLTTNDLPTGSRGAQLFAAYQASRESMAGKQVSGSLTSLGLGGLS